MIVCADDFGIADDVNSAIIDLAKRGRVSAVSCMVTLPCFNRSAFDELLGHASHLDIGLHLTFTRVPLMSETSGRNSSGMVSLFCKGVCGRISPDDIAGRIAAQYERFVAYAGFPPVYLDSHLHTHQIPGLGRGLLRFLETMNPAAGPYVRNSAMPLAKIMRQAVSPLKCMAIAFPGVRFSRLLTQAGWRTNRGFAGVYAYQNYQAYPQYLARFVSHMESSSGILMTHPGGIEDWRRMEYLTIRDSFPLEGHINRFPTGPQREK